MYDWLSRFLTIDLNIFSIFLLIALYISLNQNTVIRRTAANRIYLLIIILTITLAAVDSIGWLADGQSFFSARFLNLAANGLLNLLAPLPGALWFLYVHHQIYNDSRAFFKIIPLLAIPVALNLILTLINFKTGWYFYIDQANIYHRGSLFPLHLIFVYLFLILSFALIWLNRRRLTRTIRMALILFSLPPLIGTALQNLFYGISLIFPSLALAIFLVFLRLQNKSLDTDTLTGVYNRRSFDRNLQIKLERARKPFALIVTDLDNFKLINDRLGHATGDEALIEAAAIFRSVLREDDFIARFGGDEFYLLLNLGENENLEDIVARIKDAFVRFNQSENKPYQLSISVGSACFDPEIDLTPLDFVRRVDHLMYEDKARADNVSVSPHQIF